jgi:hypothetical protein
MILVVVATAHGSVRVPMEVAQIIVANIRVHAALVYPVYAKVLIAYHVIAVRAAGKMDAESFGMIQAVAMFHPLLPVACHGADRLLMVNQ